MQDDRRVRDYEFEQLKLENLRRIHRADQRAFLFEKNKHRLIYFACIGAFALGYFLGSFTK